VKLRRSRFRFQRVAAAFRCLSFTTEFVGTSFDAAPGFSVLKNVRRGLSDFPGHFSGSGRGCPAGFCVVLGLRGSGEGRLG
jgi:hypothetical protein